MFGTPQVLAALQMCMGSDNVTVLEAWCNVKASENVTIGCIIAVRIDDDAAPAISLLCHQGGHNALLGSSQPLPLTPAHLGHHLGSQAHAMGSLFLRLAGFLPASKARPVIAEPGTAR